MKCILARCEKEAIIKCSVTKYGYCSDEHWDIMHDKQTLHHEKREI